MQHPANIPQNEQIQTLSLIKDARTQGVSLWVEGASLRFKAVRGMPPTLAAQLRQHKESLISFLCSPPPMPSPLPLESPPTSPLPPQVAPPSPTKCPPALRSKDKRSPKNAKEDDSPTIHKGVRPVIPLPGPLPPSTHPLAPVYAAYDAAYQDRALYGNPKRVDLILQHTVDAARAAGFQVENFDRDLYPLLRPWIMSQGEPKGIARWKPALWNLAIPLAQLPIEQAALAIQQAALQEGLPIGQRESEELWRDLNGGVSS